MKRLLELLRDGNSRTIEQLAAELGTTPADINRQLGFLEHIRRDSQGIFLRAEDLRRQLQGLQPRRMQGLYAEKRRAEHGRDVGGRKTALIFLHQYNDGREQPIGRSRPFVLSAYFLENGPFFS